MHVWGTDFGIVSNWGWAEVTVNNGNRQKMSYQSVYGSKSVKSALSTFFMALPTDLDLIMFLILRVSTTSDY